MFSSSSDCILSAGHKMAEFHHIWSASSSFKMQIKSDFNRLIHYKHGGWSTQLKQRWTVNFVCFGGFQERKVCVWAMKRGRWGRRSKTSRSERLSQSEAAAYRRFLLQRWSRYAWLVLNEAQVDVERWRGSPAAGSFWLEALIWWVKI